MSENVQSNSHQSPAPSQEDDRHGINQIIRCVECGEMFNFTNGEAAYYHEKELSTPRRCIKCRVARRQQRHQEDTRGY